MRKAINHSTINEFHDFVRRAIPLAKGAVQDVDAWLALGDADDQLLTVNGAGDGYRVAALLELKRSFIAVESWRPFDDDRPAYAALLSLARAAGVPLYVVYYRKGVAIEDETPLAVFRLESATPDLRGYRKVLTGAAFAERFPDLTGPP
jgi:hypothetical protein